MPRSAASILGRVLCTLAIAAFLAMPGGARAQDETEVDPPEQSSDIGFKVFDVAMLRTSGALSLIVGAGLLIPAAIMAAPGGRSAMEESYDLFVAYPYEYTFVRPLGDE